jgi:hypothetical protein
MSRACGLDAVMEQYPLEDEKCRNWTDDISEKPSEEKRNKILGMINDNASSKLIGTYKV